MGGLPLTFSSSDYKAVTSSSTQFDTTMIAGVQYVLRSSVDCWIRTGSNPTAAADTDENHFVKAGFPVLLAKKETATKVAIIRDSADGDATLSALEHGST
jgi:hypothetical protein